MSTIQIRVDDKTKHGAKRVLDKLGLDMSSAIKLFLKQVSIHKGLPFRVVTENGLSPQDERDILLASEEAKRNKNVSKTMTPKEALRYLDSLS